MARAESQALFLVQDQLVQEYSIEHRFRAADLVRIHQLWLGDIYPWAGEYRQVNIGKGGFQFANAQLISNLMRDWERGPLAKYTPCNTFTPEQLAEAMAVVHAELILIHPFRDGNGRVARLLALLMGLQANLPAVDFTPLAGRNRLRYIGSIHAAVGRDYRPLTALFQKVIEQSLSA